MTWLPWLAVFLRHLVVAAVLVIASEREWREHCAAMRKHWSARPWAA